jgi:type IV pilus assembly protein PilW
MQGLSLVELMVALTIGLFLIGGVISLQLSSRSAYSDTERYARMGENGRYAWQTLERDLRLAGFLGAAVAGEIVRDSNLGAVASDCATPADAYGLVNAIAATRIDSSGAAWGCITDGVPGTDAVVIKAVRPFPLTDGVRDDVSDDQGKIAGLDNNKVYLMANSLGGRLSFGKDVAPADFPAGAAWEYNLQVYYIRRDNGNCTVPCLVRKVLTREAGGMKLESEEVAQGIERLQLMAGVDGNGDGVADRYRSTQDMTIADWPRVSAIQLYLLVRGLEPDASLSSAVERSYQLGNEILPPFKDSYQRMVMQGVVQLRNRRQLGGIGAGT